MLVEISVEAELDLEEIFEYTLTMHGIERAKKYVSAFDDIFESLAQYPELGKNRIEVRMGLRSFVKDFHVVFYRIIQDRIRIVRILHRSRDLAPL